MSVSLRVSNHQLLRSNRRSKDGKQHVYWSLVETVRTLDGPRQRTLCYLGELNSSSQARWAKTFWFDPVMTRGLGQEGRSTLHRVFETLGLQAMNFFGSDLEKSLKPGRW